FQELVSPTLSLGHGLLFVLVLIFHLRPLTKHIINTHTYTWVRVVLAYAKALEGGSQLPLWWGHVRHLSYRSAGSTRASHRIRICVPNGDLSRLPPTGALHEICQ